MFHNENFKLTVPPMPEVKAHDPIQNCKHLLPCGYCERKNEECKKSIPGVKDVFEELLEDIRKNYPIKSRVKYSLDDESWTNGYEECLYDLKELIENL